VNKGLALLSSVCLIVAFQNCSQETLTSTSTGSESLKSSDVLVTLPDASESKAKIDFVEIPDIQSDAVAQKASLSVSPEGADSYRLVISVESGVLQILDQSNSVMDRGCLSASDLQELQTILSGSRICQRLLQQEDLMCAQVYKASYVSLYSDDKKISLGEERDSCGNGKKDLCGDLSKVFQAYVAHIRTHWSKMSCE
jgi:hypothetical protein